MVKEVKLQKADFKGRGKAREVLRERTMVFLLKVQLSTFSGTIFKVLLNSFTKRDTCAKPESRLCEHLTKSFL